ncbi:MAG: oligosaccharide flippase family protein [Chloroflexi bacterium]|nr:oligosaccharide flippase family protein [Chloroflexota bacterium]
MGWNWWILCTGFCTIIGFWYTPYLVHSLGNELFGLIPLATSVTNYFTVITTSVNRSTGRYLTIALEEEDTEKANQVFSTSFFVTLALILAVIPFGIGIVIFAPDIFNVPLNGEKEVQYIFVFAIIALMLSTLQGNFAVVSYSQNRFDLKNVIRLISRVAQVSIVIVLFSLYTPNLLIAGLGVIAVPLVGISGEVIFWKKLLPNLKLKLESLKLALLKKMMGTSFWMLVITIGSLLITSMELVVANKTLGLNVAGMYGALFTFPNNLRFLAGTVGGVWGPTILAKSSSPNKEEMDYFVKLALKFTGLAIALPVGYIVGFSRQLITIWLGPEFAIMDWALIFMVVTLSTNLLHNPIYTILVSQNKLKIPALITLLIGIGSVFLMFFGSKQFGAVGLAVAAAIMFSLKNSVLFPIYAAKILGYPWWHYMTRLAQVTMITLGISILSHLLGRIVEVNSYTMILATGIPVTILYGVIVYFGALNAKEKGYLTLIFKKNRKAS